jgi:hypothetical protein
VESGRRSEKGLSIAFPIDFIVNRCKASFQSTLGLCVAPRSMKELRNVFEVANAMVHESRTNHLLAYCYYALQVGAFLITELYTGVSVVWIPLIHMLPKTCSCNVFLSLLVFAHITRYCISSISKASGG